MTPNPAARKTPDNHAQAYVTTLALGLAAWLIFNSHLEAFYPLPWLAADGLLGNTLFFVISGLGIFSSLSQRQQRLADYLSRRFWRLYPAVLIVLIIQFLLITPILNFQAIHIVKTFLWPTPFTYVAIIVPMYLLAFISHRLWPKHAAALLAFFCALFYCLGYSQNMQGFSAGEKLSIGTLPAMISYSYFGFAFAMGGVIASRKSFAKFSWAWLLLAALLMVAYIVLKYLMVVRGMAAIAYPLLHLLVLALCLLALKIVCAPELVSRALKWPALGPFLRLSGSLSFEIYLVHAVLLHIAFFPTIAFPFNILVFGLLTLLLAVGLQRVTKTIQARFETRISLK
jgi:peptidoglycan/LPS O-acetylase OafA/YrhL